MQKFYYFFSSIVKLDVQFENLNWNIIKYKIPSNMLLNKDTVKDSR